MPRVFLIRHGEATHNVSGDHSEGDPVLTPTGQAQARSLASLHPAFYSLLDPSSTLLVSSPFHRTLATTLLAFSSVLPSIPLLLLPQVQETGDEPCDTGADLESTQEMFPEPWLDWSECTEGWNVKADFYAPQVEVQLERSRWVRKWIRDRPEEVVVIVTHNGFLRAITKTPKVQGVICWPNAEVREYAFVDPTYEDEEADVVRVDSGL